MRSLAAFLFMILLLAGFGLLLLTLWRARRAVLAHLRRRPRLLAGMAFLFGLANGLLVAGLLRDFAGWWALLGAGGLAAFWLAMVRIAAVESGAR